MADILSVPTRQHRRVLTVLERLSNLVKNDTIHVQTISRSIDDMLDDLLEDGVDAGYVPEIDPRGNMEDRKFSMWHVDGIDEEKDDDCGK